MSPRRTSTSSITLRCRCAASSLLSVDESTCPTVRTTSPSRYNIFLRYIYSIFFSIYVKTFICFEFLFACCTLHGILSTNYCITLHTTHSTHSTHLHILSTHTTLYSILYTLHCTNILHTYILHTTHYTLHTTHYTLSATYTTYYCYTTHYTLCILNSLYIYSYL